MNESKWEWIFLSLGKGEIPPSLYLSCNSGHTTSTMGLAEISGDAAALERAFWQRRQGIPKGKRGQGAEPLGAGSSAQPSGCLHGTGRVCPARRHLQSQWWRKTVVQMEEETFAFSHWLRHFSSSRFLFIY